MDETTKCAILLSHLDAATRDEILLRLPEPARLTILQRQADGLPSVSESQLVELVREYQEQLRRGPTVAAPEELTDAAPAASPVSARERSPLEMLPLDRLASALSGERSEAVAAVVAMMPPETDTELFRALPERVRQEVVGLLPQMRPVSAPVREELIAHLQERCRPPAGLRSAGAGVLSRLLHLDDPGVVHLVRETLSRDDLELLKNGEASGIC